MTSMIPWSAGVTVDVQRGRIENASDLRVALAHTASAQVDAIRQGSNQVVAAVLGSGAALSRKIDAGMEELSMGQAELSFYASQTAAGIQDMRRDLSSIWSILGNNLAAITAELHKMNETLEAILKEVALADRMKEAREARAQVFESRNRSAGGLDELIADSLQRA